MSSVVSKSRGYVDGRFHNKVHSLPGEGQWGDIWSRSVPKVANRKVKGDMLVRADIAAHWGISATVDRIKIVCSALIQISL